MSIIYYIIYIITLFFSIFSFTPTLTSIPTSTSTPIPIPTSTPTPIPILTPVPINTWDAEERELVRLLEEYRGDELKYDANLTKAAEWMSNDMLVNDYWPTASFCSQRGLEMHCDSLGREWYERLADFGWGSDTGLGEVLSVNSNTAQSVLDAWKISPSHNNVLLVSQMRYVGVSYVEGYWTLVLGYR